MGYRFSEIVDIAELQSLCEIFTQLTGFVTAILDLDGNVLTATGWQEVCTVFHRKNPLSVAKCRESDTILSHNHQQDDKFYFYRCGNGLMDVAVPIVIEGEQVANLYSGQFFFEAPDLEYFLHQAAEYGFDESSYLEAIAKVPIVSEDQARNVMEFLSRLAVMFGNMGLANLRSQKANEQLEKQRVYLESLVAERTEELKHKNERLETEIGERIAAEERYRSIYENAVMGIFQSTAEGRFLTVNPAFARIFGYASPEETINSLTDLRSQLYVNAEQRTELLSMAEEQGVVEGYEVRLYRKDGSLVWVDLTIRIVRDENGATLYYEGTVRDITDRKRMEDELQLSQFCLDKASIGIFRGGPDARIRFVNEYGARMLGYSQQELLSLRFFDIDPTITADWWKEHRTKLAAAGASTFESLHRRKDGTTFPVEVTVNYLKYRDYEFSCSFSQDITERKLAEERIRASLKEKEVLLKEIHHRVKNNLQIVSSLLEFQSDSISDPRSRSFFHECQDRINSMALIHEKLYQTRDFVSIDFGEYLEHLAQHLFRSYGADISSISLKMEVGKVPVGIDEAIPCGLIANELVCNALKYAFPAGITGEIVVRCDTDSDGRVTMSIADNGVGLPAGFDFSNTETLGYQLVVMLTKQLRGTVEVRSDHGVAVTVRFMAKAGQ